MSTGSEARSVAAIIVNYNGQQWLGRCLDSVLGQTRPPEEIIVVDNASTDGSSQIVRQRYPQVQLLQLPENLGFAAACNRGIDSSQSELVAILNNDLKLDSTWLESLLKYDQPEWSLWASRIVFDSRPDRIDSAGDGMAVIGAGYKRGHGRPAVQYETATEVFGACAAAALYRRSLLEEIGGFDEDYFLVHEDGDLNFRARLLGHRCIYVPEARVRHCVNTSIGRFSKTYVFYGHRNSEFLYWKCVPMPFLLLYLPERLLFNLFSALYFTAKGRGGSFVLAKLDFLQHLRSVWRKRQKIQQGRRISWRELREKLDRNWLRFRHNPRF